MKKIALISTIPLSLKAFSLDFMHYLQQQGYQVSACSSLGPEMAMIKQQGFNCHEITMARSIHPQQDMQALRKLTALFKQEQFDLVHTQTAKAGFLGRWAAHKAKTPVVVHTAHNWPFHPLVPPVQKFIYKQLEKKAAQWSDAIIVDTQAVRQYGIQHHVAPQQKIHQIYMGIDLDRFKPVDPQARKSLRSSQGCNDNTIVIGTIARLVPDKGMEILLSAVAQLKQAAQVRLFIVGDGPLRPQLQQQIVQQGLEQIVTFCGHQDDVLPYLQMFDIFCLPTLREGFGVVFAEAQSCQVPVVASDIGPLREVVNHGVTGFLVPPHDVTAFAVAMQKLFDSSVRYAMGVAGRQYVRKNFDINTINEKTLQLYRQLWQNKAI